MEFFTQQQIKIEFFLNKSIPPVFEWMDDYMGAAGKIFEKLYFIFVPMAPRGRRKIVKKIYFNK